MSFIYYLDLFPPKFGLLHLSFLPSTIVGILLKFKQQCDLFIFFIKSVEHLPESYISALIFSLLLLNFVIQLW